jgi:hypothetical protein
MASGCAPVVEAGDVTGLQRCALTQVVVRDEHDQTLASRRGLVSPDPPDETRILAGGIQRRRYRHELNARSASEQVSRLVRAEILSELRVDGKRMPSENRDADTSAGDPKIGDVQDLPRLIAQLLLFIGLAGTVLDERACLRKDVVGDGFDVLARHREVNCMTVVGELARAIDNGLGLPVELGHSCAT